MSLGKVNSCAAMAQGVCGPRAAAECLGKGKEGENDDSLQGTISQSSSHPSDPVKGTRTHWGEPPVYDPERRRS